MPVSTTHAVIAGAVAGSVASHHSISGSGDITFLGVICMILAMFFFFTGCSGAYNALESYSDEKYFYVIISIISFSIFSIMIYFLYE